MEEKFDSRVHWFTLCEMGLTGLHDSYSSWHLYICRFLFGLSTSCCFTLVYDGRFVLCCTEKIEPLACCFVEFDISVNLPCVSALF